MAILQPKQKLAFWNVKSHSQTVALCADHVIFEVLKMGSNIEIFLKLWIFVLIQFSPEEKLWPKFTVWGVFKPLRCLNTKEIKLQISIGMICTSFRSCFFQLKIKKKTNIQNSTIISIFDANFNTSNMTWSTHLPTLFILSSVGFGICECSISSSDSIIMSSNVTWIRAPHLCVYLE